MKAVLVATIGTRDLIFQISSGLWYNIGDDRLKDGDLIGEQAEVISHLSLPTPITYRDLTHLLLEQIEKYCNRIKPVIIGKLLAEIYSHLFKDSDLFCKSLNFKIYLKSLPIYSSLFHHYLRGNT